MEKYKTQEDQVNRAYLRHENKLEGTIEEKRYRRSLRLKSVNQYTD